MSISKVIGVGSISSLKHLKRQLLLVDEIAVVLGVDNTGEWSIRQKDPRLAADLDWLRDRGVVWATNAAAGAINVAMRSNDLAEVALIDERVVISLPPYSSKTPVPDPAPAKRTARVSDLVDALSDICCRVECQWLEKRRPVKALSLHPPSPIVGGVEGLTGVRGEVLSVVLNSLPLPEDDVSLGDILEFRADSGARNSLLSLRKWIGALAASNSSPGECAQELEWLLSQYEEYMRLHQLRVRKGIVETVITAGAQAAEDLVKIKWGSLANSLFSISNRKIELMEAEIKAPGREIAYVVRTMDAFGRK